MSAITMQHSNLESKLANLTLTPTYNHAFKSLYNEIAAYNGLEENLGQYAYSKVILNHYFDKEVGYKIEYINAPFALNKELVNVNAVIIDIPIGYPTRYFDMIKTTKADMRTIYSHIRLGVATSKEKELYMTCTFHNACIGRVSTFLEENLNTTVAASECAKTLTSNEDFIKRTKLLGQTVVQTIITDLFYAYSKGPSRYVDNLVTYVFEDIKTRLKMAQERVVDEKIQALKQQSIQDICTLLHMKSPYDTSVEIKDEDLENFMIYFMANPDLRKWFDCRIKAKDFKIRQCITAINLIFANWIGTELQIVSSYYTNTNRKNVQNHDYVCKFKGKGIIGVYAEMLVQCDKFKTRK